MTIHQDVYAKAQQTVDEVVGNDRLPNLNDREELPYVDAVLKEVYRLAVSSCHGSFCWLNTYSPRINVPLPISSPQSIVTTRYILMNHPYHQVYPVT